MEEQAKTSFPLKIKPDCSVFDKDHSFSGPDSSAIKFFIEFKQEPGDDPFATATSRFMNTTPSSPGPPPNPFVKTSNKAVLTHGQITAYATSHMSAQYRTHIFSVLICGSKAQLIRWDRSSTIVTEPISYDEDPHLFDFFIRFDCLPPDVQGQDTTVSPAKPEDTKDAVKAIEELGMSQTPLLVVSVLNCAGEPLRYVVESPLALPWVPVGHWTQTSIGYDIQRKRSIFMKDSWRPLLKGILKEGDVYSIFQTNGVSDVPYCSSSGDIGDKTYHLTQTDLFSVKANWAPNYVYDLTPHCHYCLILDDIGQPFDKFKRSHDMVHAVHAALVGKFFFDRVEVYLSDSCTLVAHQAAFKCGILHCDISPGNILITSDTRFNGGLLIDWDLCKDMNSQVDGPRRAACTVSIKICHTLGTHELYLGHVAVHGC
jgi:Fungal protein kinase